MRLLYTIALVSFLLSGKAQVDPSWIMPVKERADWIDNMLEYRIDSLLPQLMDRTGGDMELLCDIIEIFVGLVEWDGGSSYHFRRSQLFQFEYKPDLGCGGRLSEGACGVVEGGAIILLDEDVGGTPCELTLDWSLRLIDVP